MTIIVNVLGNGCIQSDIIDNVTAQNVMYERFASEHYVMPEEIIIVNNTKGVEMDLQSMIQSELDKQLQGQ